MNKSTATAKLKSSLPALDRLVTWWLGEISSMFAEVTKGRFSRGVDAVLITFEDQEVRFESHADDTASDLGSVSADSPALDPAIAAAILDEGGQRRQFILCFPSSRGLIKTVSFPAAAEKNLARILSFEVARQTPFRPDQVYYDHRIGARDEAAGKVDVRLAVVPKSVADSKLDLLAGWNVRPRSINLVAENGEVEASIRLEHKSGNAADGKRWPARHPAIATMAAVVLALLVGAPMFARIGAKEELEARIEAVRAEAGNAAALRDEINVLMGQNSFLHGRKRELPVMTAILDEVTRLLPDTTWLNRLEIRGQDLQIHGNSPQASALIGILEASRYLSDVQFRSPVTRDQRAGNERFHISATVAAGLL